MRLMVGLLAALLVLSTPGAMSLPGAQASEPAVEIKLLSVSAWLGQIEPMAAADGQSVGGASLLGAYWQAQRDAGTLSLGSGNSFGSSPPISNLFDDRPAIEAMNLIGFDVDTLGNDNFDHGIDYLQHAINAAHFDFVAANLEGLEDNLTGVERFRIFDLQGVKVAVIGVVDPASPALVFPGNFGSLRVTDPALAAMAARDDSARAGANVFVLLTEMGAAEGAGGPLLDLASRLQGFDVILGRSFGGDFSAGIDQTLVVANQSRGASFARTTLHYEAGKVAAKSVSFFPVTDRIAPSGPLEALVASYRAQLSARLSQVIATSTTSLPAGDVCGQVQGRTCESLIGNLSADAVRQSQSADFALLNSGGIRGPLTCEAPGGAGFCPPAPSLAITEGLLHSALPFGNRAVSLSVSGAQLKEMLENGVSAMPAAEGRFPQVSGFCFTYDLSRPAGSRVTSAVRQQADGLCSGDIDLGPASTYSLATNDFIAAGGDGYPRPAVAPVYGPPLVDVLRAFLEQSPSVHPQAGGRIHCISSGAAACPRPGASVAVSEQPTATSQTIRPPSTGDAGLR